MNNRYLSIYYTNLDKFYKIRFTKLKTYIN
ncbi:hypothetical protein [Candidatus Fukatsuia anoeciicola]